MNEHSFSYREVIPDQTLVEKWKEITLNTGGRQSTLQDIKVAERSNGYCYRDSSKPYTRNRFIYWRIIHDILEIIEQSLDITLAGNALRYRFVDTPILDGITIHETCTNVIILVPTVCSIHRLVFPHPDKFHRQDELLGTHPDLVVPSIFSEASVTQAKSPSTFHIIVNPSNAGSQLPHCAASWFTRADEEAYFVLSYLSGDVLLVKQLENGVCDSVELKFESLVPRFLYGLAEKFRSKNSDGNIVVSIVLHTIGLETYALTLCKNGHLRVWSCTKGQCISASDLLTETIGNNSLQGAQNHMLKKAVGDNETDFIVGVVLNFLPECQFHILKPIINGNQFRLIKLNTLYSPGIDLVDFSLTTTRIWSVWRGEDGECSVYSAALSYGGEKGSYWMPVILEPLPDPDEIPSDPDLDPKQVYLEYIFHPGRFSLNIISKALSIYKKSSVMSDINLSSGVLKQRICIAVENEIQAELQESEVSDDEYLECANWCWSRFYSCCVQYHITGLRPLGILLLPTVSGAVLLKKSTYSFLRPLDVLEHLFLCSNYLSRDQLMSHPQLGVSFEETDDLIELVSILVHLDEQLNDSFKITFQNELHQLKSPDIVMANLMDEVMTGMNEEFSYFITPKLSNCRDVYNVLHKILELLRLDQCLTDSEKVPVELQSSINHLFSSQLGISFASQSLKQQINIRFIFCRSLLALQNIILEIKKDSWNFIEAVRSVCMPETAVLIQAYNVMTWLTNLTAQSTLTSDAAVQKLAPLKLSMVFNLKSGLNGISLMDLFIGSAGGFQAHKMICNLNIYEDNLPHWNITLLQYLENLMLLLWPINGNSMFAEWLLCSGQYIWLQEYVRYLHNWCEWDHLSRNFLLAASFLTTGEFQKAYDLFLKAAKGVYTEQFLIDRIANFTCDTQNHCILYFLKVIQLFELHSAKNFAILVADTALTLCDDGDPLKATLYSIKFKHHLALGHYDRAYNSMLSNPDKERKKDNLRELVKTLLDKRDLDTLMSFTYVGMQELFCSILFMRARAMDSIDNIYYDFLYSYQIKRGAPFFRLAASVMYEQAFRLTQYSTIEALEKQVKCYLASVNAFNLCDPKFAWVLKPVDPDTAEEVIELPTEAGSELEPEVIKLKRQLDVIDLATIKKELAVSIARLKLAKFDKKLVTNYMTGPAELIMYLSCAGIFKCALNLCTMFEVSYEPVFEIFAQHCLHLSDQNESDAWNWLVENDLPDMDIIGNTPVEVAWQLLQTLLFQYEEKHMTTLHRVVCEKILNVGAFIPYWLLSSYKKRNASELLRLYYYRGYLVEAVNLAKENILAVLDYGGEYFGYDRSLLPGVAPFCLPVNVIDTLLHELELQNQHDATKPLEKEFNELQQLFIKYLETSARISNEVCRSKMSDVY